jgi:hypothetical protein
MSDWRESSEGDLDPDLTEEAGYAGWDPPARAWLPAVIRALGVLALAGMVGGAVLFLIR